MGLTVAATRMLDRQHGVIARRQLLRQLTPGQVDALLRRDHLERYHHGTYRRPGSAHEPIQELVAATLRCRAGARASGERILHLLGVEDVRPDAPFVVLLPAGRRVRNVPFPTATERTASTGHARLKGLPMTTAAVALVETARTRRLDDDALLSLYDRTRWRGHVDESRLRRTLETAQPTHRGVRRWSRLLGGARSSVESPGERALLEALRTLIPPPEPQVWVAPDLRVDLLWRPHRIVLEYAGRRTHTDQRDRARDTERDRRLQQLGYRVVHITAEDVRRPSALTAWIERIATARA